MGSGLLLWEFCLTSISFKLVGLVEILLYRVAPGFLLSAPNDPSRFWVPKLEGLIVVNI